MLFLNIVSCALLLFLNPGVNGGEPRGLSLLPVDCGFIDTERIIGSKYARLHEFPWMALIFHFAEDGGRQLKCSGTVINQRYVLTAGHCVNDAKRLQVRVGDYDREQDVDCESQGVTKVCEDQFQEIDVETAVVHEDYSIAFDISKDIALLRLKIPIDFSHKNAAPVCLPIIPELQNVSLTDKEAIIAGWELMVNGHTTSKMLKVNVPIRNNNECNEHVTIRKAKSAEQNQICTGGVEGVCQMDVGSALMLPSDVKDYGFRYVQYGIAVNGTRVCDSQNWTAFTDVSKHMEWILNNLKA